MSTSLNEPSKLGGNTEARRITKGAAAAALAAFNATGRGYLIEQSTRSQTIGYALLDSPVALAAWMLDHDTDSYYKISRAFSADPLGQPHPRPHPRQRHALLAGRHRRLGRPLVLGERTSPSRRRRPDPSPCHPPGRLQRLPRRDLQAPRSWVQIGYPTLMYYNKPARGGHFAAWEEPQLFSEQLRAALRSLR
jgi:hypothetical protein